jgi:hypothetical protein
VVPTTGFRIDPRGPPEFSPDHDRNLIQQTTFFKVRNQSSQPKVHDRQQVPHPGKVVRMRIKITDGDADTASIMPRRVIR